MAGLEDAAAARRSRTPLVEAPAAYSARFWDINRQIAAAEDGEIVVPSYTFESWEIVLIFAGGNKPPVLGIEAHGTVREVTYGGPSGSTEMGVTESPVATVFAVEESLDGHYMIIGQDPIAVPDSGPEIGRMPPLRTANSWSPPTGSSEQARLAVGGIARGSGDREQAAVAAGDEARSVLARRSRLAMKVDAHA